MARQGHGCQNGAACDDAPSHQEQGLAQGPGEALLRRVGVDGNTRHEGQRKHIGQSHEHGRRNRGAGRDRQPGTLPGEAHEQKQSRRHVAQCAEIIVGEPRGAELRVPHERQQQTERKSRVRIEPSKH